MKIEILLANGFEELAIDKRFNKFTAEKQMKIIKEINKFDMTEDEKHNYTMTKYYYCKKRNLPLNDYDYAILGKYTYNFSNDDVECAKIARKVLSKYDKETYGRGHSWSIKYTLLRIHLYYRRRGESYFCKRTGCREDGYQS